MRTFPISLLGDLFYFCSTLYLLLFCCSKQPVTNQFLKLKWCLWTAKCRISLPTMSNHSQYLPPEHVRHTTKIVWTRRVQIMLWTNFVLASLKFHFLLASVITYLHYQSKIEFLLTFFSSRQCWRRRSMVLFYSQEFCKSIFQKYEV